jgi:galactokinase/mevalonate kinase-like predicted kinase
LPKAALELTGFMPPEGVSIRKHLADHGGGVDVTVFSALPKGSGMGASSILGAVLIAALLRYSSESPTAARVIELTSALEQRMSTGGGWQDQVGGIVPGVKLLRTRPGDFQIPEISAIPQSNALTNSEGSNRCVLYYTGRTRLAKNILRTVVGDYLARREGIRGIIDRLRSGAADMADAMAKCDTDRVGHLLGEYWSLKKRIDPGSSDHRIEQLFEFAKPHLSGGTLLGAGGGGFAFFIAKSESHAAKLRAKLETSPSLASGRLYDMRIDHVGLNVSVL